MAGATAPLTGVRVVDLSRLVPGAYCTLVLADLGADVIKVEEPGVGDLVRTIPPYAGGTSVYFHALNRNKRSVTLDLRAPRARPVLERLVAGADVVVESFRPSTARRLGVSASQLRAGRPDLVHCSLTGFGQQGPYAERPAHDLNFVALTGLFEVDQPECVRAAADASRAADVPALRVPGLLVADIGGAWAAVAGICAALFHAQRSGQGSSLDISMHDVAASWLTFPAAARLFRAASASDPAFPIASDEACYNVYVTADGRHVALAAIEQKFWRAFCERTGRPEWTPQQFVPGLQRTLREQVAAVFRSRTLAEWLEVFSDADVCLTPVNSIREAIADSHLRSRGTIVEHAGNDYIRAPIGWRNAAQGDGVERLPVTPAPGLGTDTDGVLLEAGIAEDELRDLRSRGVI